MPVPARRPSPTSAARVLAALMLLTSMLSSGVASAQEVVTCEPVIVVHTPVGSEGDESAVSITAQAIDAEAEDQWINVAWEAASGVELTAITVLDSEGRVTERTEELAQGVATDVAALWFCGNTEPEAPPSDDDAPSDPPEVEDAEDTDIVDGEGDEPDGDQTSDDEVEVEEPQPANPPSAPEPDATTGRSEAATSDASGSTSVPAPSRQAGPAGSQDAAAEEDGQDPSDDPDPDDEPEEDQTSLTDDDTPSPRSEPRSVDDEVGSVDTDEVSDAEVEVLGVQLTQDDERTGPGWAMLLLVLGLGVLAVGVGVSAWRHWPAR